MPPLGQLSAAGQAPCPFRVSCASIQPPTPLCWPRHWLTWTSSGRAACSTARSQWRRASFGLWTVCPRCSMRSWPRWILPRQAPVSCAPSSQCSATMIARCSCWSACAVRARTTRCGRSPWTAPVGTWRRPTPPTRPPSTSLKMLSAFACLWIARWWRPTLRTAGQWSAHACTPTQPSCDSSRRCDTLRGTCGCECLTWGPPRRRPGRCEVRTTRRRGA
mmetsp:Transcript_6722/g.21288  ORF Transcript_6722/g.21288 Transcript_6722/m.21288 type:complete len:219 (+) Transcript_6722:1101-1757(+)